MIPDQVLLFLDLYVEKVKGEMKKEEVTGQSKVTIEVNRKGEISRK